MEEDPTGTSQCSLSSALTKAGAVATYVPVWAFDFEFWFSFVVLPLLFHLCCLT